MSGENGIRIHYYEDLLQLANDRGFGTVFAFLKHLHQEKRLQIRQIAALTKRSPSGIGKLFKKFQIPARSPNKDKINPEVVYEGRPCKCCGGTLRYLSYKGCVACAIRRSREHYQRRKNKWLGKEE